MAADSVRSHTERETSDGFLRQEPVFRFVPEDQMDRRTFLAITTGSAATPIAGCLEGDDRFVAPADDPFPVTVEHAARGGADTVVSRTVDGDPAYGDASIECANEAHSAVRDHLAAELGDLDHVGTGRGRGPEGFDGMAITVHLTTETYDRDGTVVATADIDFDELVAVTPPTAHVRTADGERICAVPVYVEKSQAHVD